MPDRGTIADSPCSETAAMPRPRHQHFSRLLLAFALSLATALAAAAGRPVRIAIDAEFGLDNSTSAQAVELGVRAALHEINAAGGVLHGRPLELVIKDNRSMPARGIRNLRELAAMPDVVAVFGGRFSPVVIEELPELKATRTLFLDPWASADRIVDNEMQPNYIFRLSLRDSLAMPKLLETARRRGLPKIGLLLTNTSWGRSNADAAQHFAERPDSGVQLVKTVWYNWRDQTLVARYQALRQAGAQAIVLVANDDEAATLVREVAALPRDQRIPILSHWGVTGGAFAQQAGPALQQVDFSVIQTFSFFDADQERVARFLRSAAAVSPVRRIEDIASPVGAAHAYDLTHILARAIDLAGSTDRAAIRTALERVRGYHGLVRDYPAPFTAERHEALGPAQLMLARYRADGVLVPAKD